jgi:RimJ/RimL family protein N-acetyltransferase
VLPLVVDDLATARTTLRPLTEGDVDALLGWQGDAGVVRYLPYDVRSRDEVAEFVRRFSGARHLRVAHDRVVLAVVPDAATAAEIGVEPGTAIGELHLVLHSADIREFEVGWVLAPAAQGRGLAFEAAAAVVALVFGAGAHRVRAELDPRNTASAALCARLGMIQEAHHRRDFRDGEAWADTAIWAVLDTDAHP